MVSKLKRVSAMVAIMLVSACGYQLAGTGTANVPPHIKTLAIPVFKNVSQEPTIQRALTDTVRRAFITDGRLKLVNDKNADLLMKGTLTNYYIRAVAFDSNDVATEYWVYLDLEVEVIDQVKKKTYLKQKLQTRWDYRPTSSIISAEAARQEAFQQAYRDLAIRLVSLVIDKF